MLMGGTLTCASEYSERQRFGSGDVIGTLLGPERTRECFFLGNQDDETESSVIPRGLVVPAGAEPRFDLVCCLRTAQWTRASLFVSV